MPSSVAIISIGIIIIIIIIITIIISCRSVGKFIFYFIAERAKLREQERGRQSGTAGDEKRKNGNDFWYSVSVW